MPCARVKMVVGLFLFILLLIICLPCFSQKVSEKKDISLFKLSYDQYTIPDQAMGSIDEQIKSVFINLGRFNIIGMTYRLSENDINQFIDKIKELKQANTEIPESYQMGYEVFTEQDLNKMVGSFIVVIPTVSFFNTKQLEKSNDYETKIKTSFTFVDVEKGTTFAQFFVEGTGTDENEVESAQAAIDSIPAMLEFEITKIFTLETGILEVKGSEVVIELGKNMGIREGYEFEMINTRILSSGNKMNEADGLLIIKDVQDEVSFGNVIFGDAAEGSQLKEIPRVGVESTFYVHALADVLIGDGTIFAVAGMKVVAAKGFYNFRPLAGVELPLPMAANAPAGKTFALPYLYVAGVPFNVYAGGELPIYLLPRLVLAPQMALGIGCFYPYKGLDSSSSDNRIITHYGGFANVNIAYYVNRDFKVTFDVGYKLWWAPTDLLFAALFKESNLHFTYGGVMLGGGIVAKL